MSGRGLAVCREILYTARTPVLRVSSNGKAPASQADYAGSIPVTRSNFFPMPFSRHGIVVGLFVKKCLQLGVWNTAGMALPGRICRIGLVTVSKKFSFIYSLLY